MADENVPYWWWGVLAGAVSLIAGTGAATTFRQRLKQKAKDNREPKNPRS